MGNSDRQGKMNTRILKLFILLSLVSCSVNPIEQVDREVNIKLTEIITKDKKDLWVNIETVFYARLSDLGVFSNGKDSLDALYDFMQYVDSNGYPDNFYVDQTDTFTKQLITDLKQIGFNSTDTSAQRFLYNICNPIINKKGNGEIKKAGQTDLIFSYGRLNPDSVKLNFEMSAPRLLDIYSRRDLKRDGLYKTIVLFYLSKMIGTTDS